MLSIIIAQFSFRGETTDAENICIIRRIAEIYETSSHVNSHISHWINVSNFVSSTKFQKITQQRHVVWLFVIRFSFERKAADDVDA